MAEHPAFRRACRHPVVGDIDEMHERRVVSPLNDHLAARLAAREGANLDFWDEAPRHSTISDARKALWRTPRAAAYVATWAQTGIHHIAG